MTLGINSLNSVESNYGFPIDKNTGVPVVSNPIKSKLSEIVNAPLQLVRFNAKMTGNEQAMYSELVKMLATANQFDLHLLPGSISPQKKLEGLLKSGKLLDNDSNDKTSTLENLYKMATTPRIANINNTKLLSETISALYEPSVITQRFGDVPPNVKPSLLGDPDVSEEVKTNNRLMDVKASGTCVAASMEFHLANRHPAEFVRWVEGLSSEKGSVAQHVKLSSLSKNTMDAVWLLNAFEIRPETFNFNEVKLNLKPDKNAIKRVKIQNEHWDPGERTMIDVLLQSTFMQIGSQQSYDTLTDIRAGKFNMNPQGLIEFEKTFVESILANKEKFSVVYQEISPEQVLVGYKTDLSTIDRHIKDSLKSGEDVIVGYVITDSNNKIETGHEITIIDVKYDSSGKTIYVCNDTDDDNPRLVEYSADYLLPKIHHAGYSEQVIANDMELLAA